MLRKCFHKKRLFIYLFIFEGGDGNKCMFDLVMYRPISQRRCCNGEELTQTDLLEVIHVNSSSVFFMSRDYVVLFILENTFFFLKDSIVLNAVEIKSTSYFIQNMFPLNYNRLLCSQTSESHVLNKLYIM